MTRIILGITAFAALTELAACTKTGPAASPQPPPTTAAPRTARESRGQTLEARVAEYWTLRQAKDLGGTYELYSSEYRAKVSRTEFLKLTRLIRFDIVSFRIVSADAASDRASVRVAVRVVVPSLSGREVESVTEDVWVREADRLWYKLDEPLVLPFPRSPKADRE
jgi:hypothetical protein